MGTQKNSLNKAIILRTQNTGLTERWENNHNFTETCDMNDNNH